MKKTPAREWDIYASLIMLIAVLFSAWRLETAGWAEDLDQIRNIALTGYLVGLALGYSRFKKRGVILLALGYMAVMIPWQLMGAIEFENSQNWLLDKLTILFGRLITDVTELRAGRPVEDQFFVVALMCLPYWLASLYSGYNLTRHADFLKTVLPNGALMLIIHVYHYTTKDYSWMFGAYLFLALVLLSRLKYITDRKKWTQARVQVSSESGLDLTNSTVTAAAVLILLAWAIPYILPVTASGREFWRNTYGELIPRDRFDDIFASVDRESQPKPRNFLTELALGTRTPQSDQVIFRVFTPESANALPRLYWRGQVYDYYDGNKWLTTGKGESRREPSEGDIPIMDSGFTRRYGFTFDILVKGQTILYAPAQPVWVNHDAILLYAELPEEANPDEPFLDVMALRATPALEIGDLYRAGARIGNPSITELRAAGTDYPAWVQERYLQLPEDFSPRIRELAGQIAESYDNPFDKANVITNYLRDEIEYTSIFTPSDANTDPLEYFLFESKKGFCNYYATAEVLMLRSIGIPARLAVGYAQGEPNQQRSIYVVRERDLHAWPEVYFPEFGWVEFEPTGNQDPLERPLVREENEIAAGPLINPINQIPFEEEDEPPPPNREDESAPEQAWFSRMASVLPWLGGVFFLLLGLAMRNRFAPELTAASILRRAIERAGWTPPRWLSRWLVFMNRLPIERHFHTVNISLRWMKRPQPAHVTAYERAQLLKRILPGAADSIEELLNEHQSEMFTPRGGNEAYARRAAWDIIYKTVQRRLKIAILGYNYAEEQEIPPHPL
jgi:transglutaminase-like putative cysteine protease